MADRLLATTYDLYADIGDSGFAGTVTVTDPLGTTASAAFTEVGLGRYQAKVTFPATPKATGFFTAAWNYGTGVYTQTFSVGNDPGTTLSDVRAALVSRVGYAYQGAVQSADATTVTDSDIVGVPDDLVGKWLIAGPESDSKGMARRVTAFDGTALTLSRAFPVNLQAGETFLLVDEHLQPRRVDEAIRTTINGIHDKTYISVEATTLAVDTNGNVTLPTGWSHVARVFSTATDGTVTEVGPDAWALLAGRVLSIPSLDATFTVTITGVRHAGVPQFEDSIIDIPAMIVIPRAENDLHLTMAGGPATDSDAHLQRAAAAFQEYGVQLTINLPRIPNNSREIIP